MYRNMNKLNQIFSISVLIVLFALLFLIVGGYGLYKLTGVNLGKNPIEEDINPIEEGIIPIKWVERYPFTDTLGEDTNIDMNNSETNVYLLYDMIMSRLGKAGERYNQFIYKHYKIAEWGNIINEIISSRRSPIRLNNGYWTFIFSRSKENYESVQKKVSAIESLNNYLKTEDIPFIYVQPAMKLCKYEPELPVGIVDYTNENIDMLIDGLKDKGIQHLDMRQSIHEDFNDHYSLFYKTDHHWSINTGLWAANVIETEIENRFGLSFCRKYNNLPMFTEKVYKDAMFGPAGQAVTHSVEKSEDFSILFPNFETQFSLTIPDKGVDDIGNFEKVFVDYETLEKEIASGGGYAYETILYGSRPLVQIKNLHNEDGPKVLMIRDSFGTAVAPYMAIGCSALDLIDIRPEQGNFNGSVRCYIDRMQPDIVIMLVWSPSNEYK